MDCCSGSTTERLVTSNTTKFLYRSSLLMKFSGASTENLGSILDLPKQKWHTEKSIITQIPLKESGSGLCNVSNALKNLGLIPDSPGLPCKPKWVNYCAQRRHTNWLSTGITSVQWLSNPCDSYGCVLPLFICLPDIKSRCQDNR